MNQDLIIRIYSMCVLNIVDHVPDGIKSLLSSINDLYIIPVQVTVTDHGLQIVIPLRMDGYDHLIEQS